MKLARLIAAEIAQTCRRPGRILNVLRVDRLMRYLRFQRLRLLAADDWDGTGAVAARAVGSYERYVELQRSKLEYLDLASHEVRFRCVLGERLRDRRDILPGARVICLGARLGAEVAAFRDLGCFAFGVDLNPGADNPWVVHGDFHRLELPDACVDVVYTNSLDHCLDAERVLAEVRRILAPHGRLIVEADPGIDDACGVEPDMWATFQWKTVDAFAELIERSGFALIDRRPFQYPRNGTSLAFALAK